ncbi:MAG: ABC transporter ATP-binding protein [Eubacteriales bacterium]|nr:ABC transporter ATP-binding protein [Eubacteriales bacterium]
METAKYAIDIQNLTKKYRKTRGVTGLTLQVEEGDVFGFLGPNGAGKSTTIRSILGLLQYQEGEINVLGMDAKKERKKMLMNIGYLPSEVMFYPTMKAKDVIRYAADMRQMDCKAEAEMLCERLQINGEKRIEELSLGNRKKIGIVCAMQHRPKLFILDEPTSGLDPFMQAEFFKLIMEYNKMGTTCFLSSHVLTEIKKYCKHVAIIREGQLVCTDTVENLTKRHGKSVKLVKDGVMEEFLYNGDLNVLFQSFAGHDISDIVIEEPDMEEIFMSYYTK